MHQVQAQSWSQVLELESSAATCPCQFGTVLSQQVAGTSAALSTKAVGAGALLPLFSWRFLGMRYGHVRWEFDS
eukprot:11696077-Prorocentrum_lima.AAC.1